MNKYVRKYIWFPLVFLLGCSALSHQNNSPSPNQKIAVMDDTGSRLLEKRIDDLSTTITFIINDTNRLHNKMDEIKVSNITIQKKIEGLEIMVGDLDKQIAVLAASAQTAEREVFMKDSIVRLTESAFPDIQGIQWNILSFDHKGQVTHVEAEPTPASLEYPRFKFIISFKNPEMPRIIEVLGFQDDQYRLVNLEKK
ncbi:MAG: hypothetical protein E3K32_08415 [wastewater metagenome]|nr:hypothetical protein [Candidatus Loosdrechtia aerotolerans]